jgi:Fur family transcriptional regulator, ferric uptake regulator
MIVSYQYQIVNASSRKAGPHNVKERPHRKQNLSYDTRNRRIVITVLKSAKWAMTAADIHAHAWEENRRISLSTIYRTLEWLVSRGKVTTHVGPGSVRYLFSDSQYRGLLFCRRCRHVEHIDVPDVSALLHRHDFTVESYALEYRGICARCKS